MSSGHQRIIGEETLPKISIRWVGCTNVTDRRQTDGWTWTHMNTSSHSLINKWTKSKQNKEDPVKQKKNPNSSQSAITNTNVTISFLLLKSIVRGCCGWRSPKQTFADYCSWLFASWMLFLMPKQQHYQSMEGQRKNKYSEVQYSHCTLGRQR